MSGVTGGTLPAELWREAMVLAHKGKPERSLQTGAPISRFSDLMNRLGGGY